jgi:Galactose oxidase, central domain/Kelch motif
MRIDSPQTVTVLSVQMVEENAPLAVSGLLCTPAIVLESPDVAPSIRMLVPNALLPAIACEGRSTKEKRISMMPAKKIFALACLTLTAFVLASCSGIPGGSTGGGGTTSTSTFTISVTVSGLSGTGLVLQDNATDNLAISTSGTFTFKTPVAKYLVTVLTQPSNPAQTCTVTSGSGTATANVTSVAVACTTNPVTATIGGTLSGLATGASVILEDNGGDALTLSANGSFTFKTAVTGPTDAYAVTVNTQPTTPNQICTVANGSGTASANVTNVAVTCVLSYTIGGNVTGLVGTGLILQNSSDSEQLAISAANGNEAFTFKNLVPTGTAYTISIFAQPTGPVQTCVITPGTASGTATANVTSVAITCPAVTYSVGGTVFGLAGVLPNNGPLTDGTFILENVLGNTLTITQNGPFVFATPEALNDQYEISVLHSASTQFQGCTRWGYKGVVTANVSNIEVDCGHNDWTWIDGTNTAGVAVPPAPQYGSFSTSPPTPTTPTPNPFTNTPGARYSGAGWTDKYGNLFLFGGDGWELSGSTQEDTLDAPMDDLWVCVKWDIDDCQWQLVGGYDPTVTGTTTVGASIIANAQHEGQNGFYPGTPIAPPARLGAATWTDSNGNFWLFGGKSVGAHFFNDLWVYNPSVFDGTTATYQTKEGQWTQASTAANSVDQPGTYTGAANALIPGSRVNPVTWVDGSGNLWLFGGYGYDGSGTIGYLNDLWEYTPGGNWTWVSGGTTNAANQLGAYGTPAMPGGRHEAVGWADTNGNLWLFGGEGEDSVGTANGILNDLWVYNITNNQWTFVTGSNKANQTGTYPVQTIVGPVNITGAAGTCGLAVGNTTLNCSPVSETGALPGSRWGASGWIDASGNLWLFGGWGLDSTATNGNGALNDLWVYTPNATAGQPGTWAWIKGSNTGSQNGQYGALTRPYVTHYTFTPGGRSNATHWIDNLGQLWLFGGEGYDATSTTGNGYLNDLWRYLPYAD